MKVKARYSSRHAIGDSINYKGRAWKLEAVIFRPAKGGGQIVQYELRRKLLAGQEPLKESRPASGRVEVVTIHTSKLEQ